MNEHIPLSLQFYPPFAPPIQTVIGEQKLSARACEMSIILLRPACAGWLNSQGHQSRLSSSPSLPLSMCDNST